jgi:multiple antibiotic resistance protein
MLDDQNLLVTQFLTLWAMLDVLSRLFGRGGTNVLRRIMGVLLAALSVNLIVTALAQWLNLPPI